MTGTSRALRDEPFEVDVVAGERLLDGRIQSFQRETFLYNGERITRDFILHPGAVAVVALDESDRVAVIRQYRHPIRSREWEIPAGLLDVAGEDMLDAAKRELAEEADLAASEWSLLSHFAMSPGGSNEFARVYLARGLSATAPFARTEEEADIEVEWVGLDDLVAAVLAGDLRNSILIVGVLATFAARASGWASLRSA